VSTDFATLGNMAGRSRGKSWLDLFKRDAPTVGTDPSTLNLLISQHGEDLFVRKSLL
jgi:hypothetical protein